MDLIPGQKKVIAQMKAQREKEEAERKAKPPQTYTEVILRAKEEFNVTGVELMQKLYQLPFMEGVKRLEEDLTAQTPEVVWFTIKKLSQPPTPNGQGA